jgi:anti-anti-sigma factor
MAQEQPQHLKAEIAGDVLVLTILDQHVEGDAIAEELRERLLQALAQTSCRHAVIDLQQVQYISSVAFRPLLSLRRSLLERNGRLVLCGLNPVVGDVFFTTRMVDPAGQPAPIFDMQPGVQEAIRFLQNPADRPKDQA